MLYDYQYAISATIVDVLLLCVFLLRWNYRTSRGYCLLALIGLNIISSLTNAFSAFTISYPTEYSTFTLYSTSAVFLFTYNIQTFVTLLFINSSPEIGKRKKWVDVYCLGLIILECIGLATSYWTKQFFYFDEQLNYCHGSLFVGLYVLAVISLIMIITYIIRYRSQFSKYQILSLTAFITGMIVCIIFQWIYPRYLIGNLVSGTFMFCIYNVFENPTNYGYRSTLCNNQTAWIETVDRGIQNARPFNIVTFTYLDYEEVLAVFDYQYMSVLSIKLADKLHVLYKHEAFCLDDNTFSVVLTQNEDVECVKEVIENVFGRDRKIFCCNVSSTVIPNSASDTEKLIRYMLSKRIDTVQSIEDVQSIIEQGEKVRKITAELEKAIADYSFRIWYQPIFDIQTGKFHSAEALIRMPKGEFENLSPEIFIPIAENSGLINRIGEIVLEKVCDFISSSTFKVLGIEYIDINLSAVQFNRSTLASELIAIMNARYVDATHINFEITETAAILDNKNLIDNMETLAKTGATFSIDDYGSGFASPEYLFKLPINMVKIDKYILWNAMKDENAMTILKSTINLLHDLKKYIVVEGVETSEMEDLLKNHHCEYLQGYLYSKPVDEEQFIQFVSNTVYQLN